MKRILFLVIILLLAFSCSKPTDVILENTELTNEVIDSLLFNATTQDIIIKKIFSRSDLTLKMFEAAAKETITTKVLKKRLVSDTTFALQVVDIAWMNPMVQEHISAIISQDTTNSAMLINNEEKQQSMLKAIARNPEMIARIQGWIEGREVEE